MNWIRSLDRKEKAVAEEFFFTTLLKTTRKVNKSRKPSCPLIESVELSISTGCERKIKKEKEGQPPEILQISWKAQTRLNKRYFRLLCRGKIAGKAITAVAREL